MARAPKEKTAKAKVTTTIRMPIKIMARAEGDLTHVPVTFVVRQVIVKRSASRNKTKAKEKTTREAKAKMERANPKAKQAKEKVQTSTLWRKPVLTNRVQKRKLQVLIGVGRRGTSRKTDPPKTGFFHPFWTQLRKTYRKQQLHRVRRFL